jgi:rhomboid family GlyGly-CTERM serine protease
MLAALRRLGTLLARLPLVTLALAVLAGAILVVGGWSGAAEFDRAAVAAGQWWRLATGHLAHWNLEHLAWDAIMLVLLGSFIEQRSRRALVAAVTISAAAISLALWWGVVDAAQYRGLSGIDSALFALVAVELLGDAWRTKRPLVAAAVLAVAVGFAGKIGYEAATGQALFVDSAAGAFTPLPLVHVVGALAGAVVGLAGLWPREARQEVSVRQISCARIT